MQKISNIYDIMENNFYIKTDKIYKIEFLRKIIIRRQKKQLK